MKTADYVRILRRSWVWLVIGTLLGVGAAGLITSRITPLYAATSGAVVSIDRGGTLNELTQGNTFTERRVATYARLAVQPMVTQPVIEDFGLNLTPGQFESKLKVTVPVDTSMIEITVQDPSPAQASSLANAMLASLRETVDDIETPTVVGTAPGSDELASTPIKITQVRFAEVPANPVSPNTPLFIIIGLVLGLGLSALAAILRDLLDTRLGGVEELETLTPAPIVGLIPRLPKGRAADLTPGPAGNTFDESFRILRTNLQFLDMGTPTSFLITSPRGGEGKTTLTSHLALALAATGASVLVVDAHLRHPELHEHFGVDGSVGLTDILIGRADFDSVVQHWDQSPLIHVLSAGNVPPNPSELLGSQRMKNLATFLGNSHYDFVLYDTAPVLGVPDATILSRLVSGVLLVTSVEHSKRDDVRSAVHAVEKTQGRLAGVIGNRLRLRRAVSRRGGSQRASAPEQKLGHQQVPEQNQTVLTPRRAANTQRNDEGQSAADTHVLPRVEAQPGDYGYHQPSHTDHGHNNYDHGHQATGTDGQVAPSYWQNQGSYRQH